MTKLRALVSSATNRVRQRADIILHLRGAVDHKPNCIARHVVIGKQNLQHRLCSCPVRTDLVELQCPACKTGLTLHVMGGPTDKKQTAKEKAKGARAFFAVTGTATEPDVKPDIACIGCGAVFSIEKGVVEIQGKLSLPTVDAQSLPKDLRDFLDETDAIHDTLEPKP